MDPQSSAPNLTMRYSDSNLGGGVRKYIAWAVFGVLTLVVWTYIDNPMLLTVTGTGERSVPAQNAVLSFTLTTTSTSANQAVSDIRAKADNVKKTVLAEGVKETDISETQITVLPQQAGGFQASLGMGFKTTRVSSVGDIVSTLYQNGVYMVGQPVLTNDNTKKFEDEAYDEALSSAHKEADKLALKNWKFIKKVISVDMATTPATSTATTKTNEQVLAGNSALETGNFKITKVVNVTYKVW